MNNKSDKKQLHFRLNGRAVTFFVCLCISIFFWLLMALSKEYSMTITFPVNYVNLPSDKVVSNNLPQTAEIEIRSRGFNLLAYRFKKTHATIDIDVKDVRSMNKKNVYYLLLNSRVDKIKSQFNNEIYVVKINPDTIFINFNRKISRQVPVRSMLTLLFNKQYHLSDSVSIDPKFVTVSAEAEVIDKLDTIQTQQLTLKNLSNSTTVKLMLQKPQGLNHIELSPAFVKATVNVTKYTEASMELPVEVENLPVGYTLRTFPDKVSVKFNVAFKNYEKINALNFRAVVDYKKIDKESNKLKVQLVKLPEGIRNVKLVNDKVEYILSK